MLRNYEACSKYDLSSVTSLFTGAAPLGVETAEDFQKMYPGVTIRQGYGKIPMCSEEICLYSCCIGLTETSTVVASTHPSDIVLGSSGCLIPGVEARIVSADGKEITSYDTPGELVVRSPSVVLGYLDNDKANKETFEDGWMRTGDEAVFRLSPKNTEHVFIVDRIKELIKVKVYMLLAYSDREFVHPC
jgi:acyl-CoA synthetase (AMP-forming)/AMP-acid ligase II